MISVANQEVLVMLPAKDLNLLFCHFGVAVHQQLLDGKHPFTVADIVGAYWAEPYYEVFAHYDKNWQVARSMMGRIFSSFVPRFQEDLGIKLSVRTVQRKGHDCAEYFFPEEPC